MSGEWINYERADGDGELPEPHFYPADFPTDAELQAKLAAPHYIDECPAEHICPAHWYWECPHCLTHIRNRDYFIKRHLEYCTEAQREQMREEYNSYGEFDTEEGD